MSCSIGLPRVVFLGTPEFAVHILEAAVSVANVVLVITQPDKPQGRGRGVAAPPVKEAAMGLGIEVIQPEVVKGRRFAERIKAYEPDFMVTAAYGKVLGRSLLMTPTRDALNVHASLLPRHRGAAPANWAILEGDELAGVCIMRMVEALDAGPVLLSRSLAIGQDETAGELLGRLSRLGAEALVEALGNYGTVELQPQDDRAATWARTLTKQDGLTDWNRSAPQVHGHARGMHPWPCAFTLWKGEPLKLHRTRVISADAQVAAPGTVVDTSAAGIDVACGLGVLRLLELQAPGRKRMECGAFLAGANLAAGERLIGR